MSAAWLVSNLCHKVAMEMFQSAFAAAAAVEFWRKDFGVWNITTDMAIIAGLFLGSQSFGACWLLALLAAMWDYRRLAQSLAKNRRMFVAMFAFEVGRRHVANRQLSAFELFASVAVLSAYMQLLRTPAKLKDTLREWRVATGPVYVFGATWAFYTFTPRQNEASSARAVRMLGAVSVLTAGIFLRPDNNALDDFLCMPWARWPSARRSFGHGVLMVLSLSSLYFLANFIRQDALAGATLFLLGTETLRRSTRPLQKIVEVLL